MRMVGRGYASGLKRVMKLYAKSKIGMIGIAVILFFCSLALFAPYFAPNPPLFVQVAPAYDIPAWAVYFPQYASVPVDRYAISDNGFTSSADLANWNIVGANLTQAFAPGVTPTSPVVPGSLLINSTVRGNTTQDFDNPYLPGGEVFYNMSTPFDFSGAPPQTFTAQLGLKMQSMANLSTAYINLIIFTPSRKNFSLSSTVAPLLGSQVSIVQSEIGTWIDPQFQSLYLPTSGYPQYQGPGSSQSVIFNETGTYHFMIQMRGVPVPNTASQTMSMYLASVSLHLGGGAFGLLGTTSGGEDVWSQLVWGSQISLLVGVLSGLGAVGLGALAGIAAGYLGGWSDEVLSRITDFVLVLPFLPLLIILVAIISSNAFLGKTVYYWVVTIFVVVSWPLIAKIIRSQVLSVKERQYVEASKALGAGTPHILRKHILPNVLGLVYSQVALNVGGFILLEAALDFLGVSPNASKIVSWGSMLNNALGDATVANSVTGHVWWWFLPPGIAIASLSLAFVLVGYALDQIFNPRLRSR